MTPRIIDPKTIRNFQCKFYITPGCWIWTACIGTHGYGRFGVFGHVEPASRVSYRIYVGDIEEGMFVLHSCDNPICVNPDHLRQGTCQDNADDMVGRGRHKGSHKITAEQATLIRADTRMLKDIAAEYGISKQNVYSIRHGISWKDLGGVAPKYMYKVKKIQSWKAWTDAEIAVLREKYATEDTTKIAVAIGRSVGQVQQKAMTLGIRKVKRSSPEKQAPMFAEVA